MHGGMKKGRMWGKKIMGREIESLSALWGMEVSEICKVWIVIENCVCKTLMSHAFGFVSPIVNVTLWAWPLIPALKNVNRTFFVVCVI